MRVLIRNSFTMTFILVLSFQVKSQQKWSLSKCVSYAIQHNIDLNIQKNTLAKQEINLHQSKMDIFPTLNLRSNLNFNFGRTIDGNTNTITFDKNMSNNYGITSSVNLFQGFVQLNTIRFNKYLLMANQQETEKIKNKLIFDVISSYYTAEYSNEIVKAAKTQVTLSKLQYNRMKKLVEIGKESPISVQDIKSQLVAEKLKLKIAKNESRQQLLKLKQLLRLDIKDSFIIDSTDLGQVFMKRMIDIDTLFSQVFSEMPEIKQQDLLLKASLKNLAIAKGKRYPELNLSVGMNSYFFDGNKLSFINQINNNQNQFISLNVYMQVFNGARVSSDIKRKIIDVENQRLNIEKQKELIISQVQRAYDNLQAAKSEYDASIELYKFSKLSFDSISEKIEKGMASTADFELGKQRLFSANAAMSKAKLSYLMYCQILIFYKTGNWNHLN